MTATQEKDGTGTLKRRKPDAGPQTTKGRAGRFDACADAEDFRVRASRRLPRMVFDYIDGAAGRESTADRNLSALRKVALCPNILQDVSRVDTSCRLFGQPSRLPIVIAPTGLNGAYWHQGDLALARAAKASGIPFVMSTAACVTLDDMHRTAGPLRWFQLYMFKDKALALSLLERVWQYGFEVLELTVDTPVGGYRNRDIRNGFSLPFRWSLPKLWDVARHPRWTAQMLAGGLPTLKLFAEVVGPIPAGETITAVMNQQLSSTFDWQDLAWLRRHWPGKLVLKGVGCAAHAVAAQREGIDGVVVSNHGGRQLDGSVSSVESLPEIVQAVGGGMVILIDSGFRSGTDVAKAIALGADGVQLGRAVLYALAAGGEAAVRRMLDIMRVELHSAMAMTGSTGIAALRGKATA
ncbi:MAG: alpha-hydroxy acid oxidase [Pigmentiphaga sp.]